MKIRISSIKSKPNLTKKGGEKKMKYSKIIITLVATGLALGTYINSQANENVRNSKHNLSLNSHIAAQGTTEVCVFCHTPHGAMTDSRFCTADKGCSAPIWNRNVNTTTNAYKIYDSPNFDGVNKGQPRGVSVACLSCHDGTVAFNSLINQPGSGNVNKISFTAHDNVDANGFMVNKPSVNAGAAGEFPMLGTDLSNDHPISMEIPCGSDPQFDSSIGAAGRPNQICDNLGAGDNATQAANQVKYLFRGDPTVLPPDKRDRIRAYPSAGDGKPYIECASCHNPHEENNAVTDPATKNLVLLSGFTGTPRDSRFLRYPSFVGTADETGIGASVLDANRNAGSLLCLSCHQK
ncbi:MAG: hypothetical protein PH343_07155 [Nitrospira sp.]|nr:hypothetical protein [Nitrospira sp.]